MEVMKKSKQQFPNLNEERKLWRKGYRFVVGIDEAGRGPLAGPVTAAAVTVRQFPISNFQFPNKFKIQKSKLKEIRDSKKLTAKQREAWYQILTKHPEIKWGIGIVSQKLIDKINIFEATKLAMKKAIIALHRKCRIFNDRQIYDISGGSVNDGVIDFLIIDGNFILENLLIKQKSIIRADEKVFSCAAASIIAKVSRDRLMIKYAKKYPEYGFDRHKGYGTRRHMESLKISGPCKIHRKSFRPICVWF